MGKNKKEGLAPLLNARLIESYKALAPSGTFLGVNDPCWKYALSPFWGVQRGETTLEGGFQGGHPLDL